MRSFISRNNNNQSSQPSLSYLHHGAHPQHTLLKTRLSDIQPPSRGCTLCRASLQSDRGEYFVCSHNQQAHVAITTANHQRQNNNNSTNNNTSCPFCLCPKCAAVYERNLSPSIIIGKKINNINNSNDNQQDTSCSSAAENSNAHDNYFSFQHRLFIRKFNSVELINNNNNTSRTTNPTSALRTRPKQDAYVLQPQLEPLVIYEAVSEGTYPPPSSSNNNTQDPPLCCSTIQQAQNVIPPFDPNQKLPFLRLNYGGWIDTNSVIALDEIRDAVFDGDQDCFNNNNASLIPTQTDCSVGDGKEISHGLISITLTTSEILLELAKYHLKHAEYQKNLILANSSNNIPPQQQQQQPKPVAPPPPPTELLQQAARLSFKLLDWDVSSDVRSEQDFLDSLLPARNDDGNNQSLLSSSFSCNLKTLRPKQITSRENLYRLWLGAVIASHLCLPAAAAMLLALNKGNAVQKNSQSSSQSSKKEQFLKKKNINDDHHNADVDSSSSSNSTPTVQTEDSEFSWIHEVSRAVQRLVTFCASVTSICYVNNSDTIASARQSQRKLLMNTCLPHLASSAVGFTQVWTSCVVFAAWFCEHNNFNKKKSNNFSSNQQNQNLVSLHSASMLASRQAASCISMCLVVTSKLLQQDEASPSAPIPSLVLFSTKMLQDEIPVVLCGDDITTNVMKTTATANNSISNNNKLPTTLQSPKRIVSRLNSYVFPPPQLHVDPTRKVVCDSLIFSLFWSVTAIGAYSWIKSSQQQNFGENNFWKFSGCEQFLFQSKEQQQLLKNKSIKSKTSSSSSSSSSMIFSMTDLIPLLELFESASAIKVDSHPVLPVAFCTSACQIFQSVTSSSSPFQNDDLSLCRQTREMFLEMDVLEMLIQIIGRSGRAGCYQGFSNQTNVIPVARAAQAIEFLVKNDHRLVDSGIYEILIPKIFHAIDRATKPEIATSLLNVLAECGRAAVGRSNAIEGNEEGSEDQTQYFPPFSSVKAQNPILHCRIRQRAAVDLLQMIRGPAEASSSSSLMNKNGDGRTSTTIPTTMSAFSKNNNNFLVNRGDDDDVVEFKRAHSGGGNFMNADFSKILQLPPKMTLMMMTTTTTSAGSVKNSHNRHQDAAQSKAAISMTAMNKTGNDGGVVIVSGTNSSSSEETQNDVSPTKKDDGESMPPRNPNQRQGRSNRNANNNDNSCNEDDEQNTRLEKPNSNNNNNTNKFMIASYSSVSIYRDAALRTPANYSATPDLQKIIPTTTKNQNNSNDQGRNIFTTSAATTTYPAFLEHKMSDTIVSVSVADNSSPRTQIDLFVCADCASSLCILGLERVSRNGNNNSSNENVLHESNFEITAKNVPSVIPCPLCPKWVPKMYRDNNSNNTIVCNNNNNNGSSVTKKPGEDAAWETPYKTTASPLANNITSQKQQQQQQLFNTRTVPVRVIQQPQKQQHELQLSAAPSNNGGMETSFSFLVEDPAHHNSEEDAPLVSMTPSSHQNNNNNNNNQNKNNMKIHVFPSSLKYGNLIPCKSVNTVQEEEEVFHSWMKSTKNSMASLSATALHQTKFLKPWWMIHRNDAERILVQLGSRFGIHMASSIWKVAFVFGEQDESLLAPMMVGGDGGDRGSVGNKHNNSLLEEQNQKNKFFQTLAESTFLKCLQAKNWFSPHPSSPASSQNHNHQQSQQQKDVSIMVDTFNNEYKTPEFNESRDFLETRLAISHLALTQPLEWISSKFDIDFFETDNKNNNNTTLEHVKIFKNMFTLVHQIGQGIENIVAREATRNQGVEETVSPLQHENCGNGQDESIIVVVEEIPPPSIPSNKNNNNQDDSSFHVFSASSAQTSCNNSFAISSQQQQNPNNNSSFYNNHNNNNKNDFSMQSQKEM